MAGKRIFLVDKKTLESLYQRMTMKQIAEQLGVGETVIHKRIHEFGIKLAGHEDAPRTRPKKFTPEHVEALRQAHRKTRGVYVGEKNHNWRGGATEQNLAARRSGAYKEWKHEALALAGNKCQQCGAAKGYVCPCCGQRVALHVHHVRSFAKHIEERFDPKNSEVLCAKCHHSKHWKIG